MFIAFHILRHLKYSCNTQQGVLVLIWFQQCHGGWYDVHVYRRRWCVTALWMPCIHYKKSFWRCFTSLNLFFSLVYFAVLWLFSEEFVFSKWDLKGQRESNTGDTVASLSSGKSLSAWLFQALNTDPLLSVSSDRFATLWAAESEDNFKNEVTAGCWGFIVSSCPGLPQ